MRTRQVGWRIAHRLEGGEASAVFRPAQLSDIPLPPQGWYPSDWGSSRSAQGDTATGGRSLQGFNMFERTHLPPYINAFDTLPQNGSVSRDSKWLLSSIHVSVCVGVWGGGGTRSCVCPHTHAHSQACMAPCRQRVVVGESALLPHSWTRNGPHPSFCLPQPAALFDYHLFQSETRE